MVSKKSSDELKAKVELAIVIVVHAKIAVTTLASKGVPMALSPKESYITRLTNQNHHGQYLRLSREHHKYRHRGSPANSEEKPSSQWGQLILKGAQHCTTFEIYQ